MKFTRPLSAFSRFCRALSRRKLGGKFGGRSEWMWALGISAFQVAIALSPQAVKPSQAAEKITFSLGATFERSISVDSLERYVETGEVSEELAPYLAYVERLDPNAGEQVRSLLSQRADLDVVTVSQFAYTPQGGYLLSQAGEVFRTGARLSGYKGLRGAAIVSAADPDGLTLLNVVRNFPTPVLRVDIRRGLAIANQVSNAFRQSDAALELIQQTALETATQPFPDGQSVSEIFQLATQSGPYLVRRFSVRLKASPKPVDIYLPQSPGFSQPLSQPVDDVWPTVMISHGFGNDRATYSYLSEHLAANGFAVINVEHQGSSGEQFDALVAGRADQVVPTEEFIRRPLLISQVLDELATMPDFKDKKLGVVDFDNVGLIGQSFGGYTALAVAGAPVNLARLRNGCPPTFTVNISLLLQCQAADLDLAEPTLDFRDSRIKAVVAINPLTSEIFGPESLARLKTPVLMMAGSRDTVAPALPEQILPFTWLTTADRYLLVMEGGTHFSTIGITGRETFQLPSDIAGPVPEVAQRYTQVMSLAFLNRYLKGDQRYESVLTSAFTNRFSQPEMPLTIVPNLDTEQLSLQLRLAELEDAIADETALTQPASDSVVLSPEQIETALKEEIERLQKRKTDRQTTPAID